MSKIYVNEKLSWVIQAKSVLEAAQIPCFVKNEFAASTAGEVPFLETWPELWVHQAADALTAKHLIQQWKSDIAASESSELEAWVCPKCKETNEPNFAVCWSCGFLLEATDQST